MSIGGGIISASANNASDAVSAGRLGRRRNEGAVVKPREILAGLVMREPAHVVRARAHPCSRPANCALAELSEGIHRDEFHTREGDKYIRLLAHAVHSAIRSEVFE